MAASVRSSENLALVMSAGPNMVPKLPSPVTRGQFVTQGGVTMATFFMAGVTSMEIVALPLLSCPSEKARSSGLNSLQST